MRNVLLGVVALLGPATVVVAQTCQPGWESPFPDAFVDNTVYCTAMFTHDGASHDQRCMFACGDFAAIGGTSCTRIARWDGVYWSPLGSGLNDSPHAMVEFDEDGAGPNPPSLFVGGFFTLAGGQTASRIARWDGTSWSAVGTGLDSYVTSLVVYDDGTGPALYAGGNFTQAGGLPANRVAKWTGTNWSALGAGTDGIVRSMLVVNDGSSPHPILYVGGAFNNAGGSPASKVARWDGTAWSAVGGTLDSDVRAMQVFDDGAGAKVYATGSFSAHLVRLDGTQWTPIANTPNGALYSLAVFDPDGAGPMPASLYLGGGFSTSNGEQDVARYDGTQWSAVGGEMDGQAQTLTTLDLDGSGQPTLVAGGNFTDASFRHVGRLVRLVGDTWAPFGNGVNTTSTNLRVDCLAMFDPDGSHPELYAGGLFNLAGTVPVGAIARWNGSRWATLGADGDLNSTGEVEAFAMHVFDDGSGPALYVGGAFQSVGSLLSPHIARWNGSAWSAPGSLSDFVHCFCVYDDGTGAALYAGGQLAIYKWNGQQWLTVGTIYQVGENDQVLAMAVFDDDGAGTHRPYLYVGGDFTKVNGLAVSGIARWDGTSWSSTGVGLHGPSGNNGKISAMQTFDDGSGPALYVAGVGFTSIDSVSVRNIARWNGTNWSPVGPLNVEECGALALFNDGSGTKLYGAGTLFAPVSAVIRWNGSTWDPWTDVPVLATSGDTNALLPVDATVWGAGVPRLFAGGAFRAISGVSAGGIADYRGCSCYANCDLSTMAPVLNVADFTCFLQKFAAGNSYANCDGSTSVPVLNVADFTCFLQKYAAGCP